MGTKQTISLKRVFIANRGEICRRIAESARYLGIESVAIDDEGQPKAFLAKAVDTLVYQKDCQPIFMDGDRLIAIAKKYHCDSIHPGFGFLSENSAFAQKVIDARLCWVGPSPQSMQAMAEKSAARALAREAGLKCVEGLNEVSLEHNPEKVFTEVEAWAKTAGYPLLIKASAGGGGRGMYLAESAKDLRNAIQRCYDEAVKSYGTGRMVIERYLRLSRHVEVQILGDQHGFVCVIGDRDCSVQRRRQKIIEEAPAPFLHEETRRDLHAQALSIAKKVGYYSAGTVEFILDWSNPTDGAKIRPYFLEMNTRLQVEHPVSEEVYGLDLVSWQFRVASGAHLPSEFAALKPRGHAVEGRIYGEDPRNNFFPAPGPVHGFYPHHGLRCRWEIGLDANDEVSEKFDPMIAKIVCTGQTRDEAMALMHHSLGATQLVGEANNKEFIQYLVMDPVFLTDGASSQFIELRGPKILASIDQAKSTNKDKVEKIFKALDDRFGKQNFNLGEESTNAFKTISAGAFALSSSAAPEEDSRLEVLEQQSRLFMRQNRKWYYLLGCGFFVENGVREFLKFHLSRSDDIWRMDILHAGLEHQKNQSQKSKKRLVTHEEVPSNVLVAQVPARVIRLLVEPNKVVESGQAILVLESMKMEYELKSTSRARVLGIDIKLGDQVRAGQVLVRFEII